MTWNAFSILSILSLTGCSSFLDTAYLTGPLELDSDISTAKNITTQGFNFYPFELSDAKVTSEDFNAMQNLTTKELVTAGFRNQLALNVTPGNNEHHKSGFFIAYIPADEIDIEDKKAINSYVKTHYYKPAIEKYMVNEPKSTVYKTRYVDEESLLMQGSICNSDAALRIKSVGYNATAECDMGYIEDKQTFNGIRYATVETMPFTPETKATRYIVATAPWSYIDIPVLKNISTNMFWAYVPKLNADNSQITSASGHRYTFLSFPYVTSKNNSAYLFAIQEKLN